MKPLAIAIDGGNSKTDLALVHGDGSVLAFVRGPLSSPHHLGVDGSVAVLSDLLDEAIAIAGLRRSQRPVADVAELLLAGLDLPIETEEFASLMDGLGWGERTIVGNDTFAVLRAGTERGWGIAVVCGAGINCVGLAPDGRQVRFAALGAITGDWGGGFDVGLAALSAAARSEDGRGPETVLEALVPARFGFGAPLELAAALHLKKLPMHRLSELAPIVLARAADDDVASGIVDRLGDEVVAFVRAALRRLDLGDQLVEVILGGGLLRSGDPRLLGHIESELRRLGPHVVVRVSPSAPIVGAALLALDELGAGPREQERLRAELGGVVAAYDEHHDLGSARPLTTSNRGQRDG